jgi:hypothetical protein
VASISRNRTKARTNKHAHLYGSLGIQHDCAVFGKGIQEDVAARRAGHLRSQIAFSSLRALSRLAEKRSREEIDPASA